MTDWTLGISERGIVLSESIAGMVRLAAFGPVPRAGALEPEITELVGSALARSMRNKVPQDDANADMERTAQDVDRVLRESFGDNRRDARGTLVTACVRDNWICVAHTGHGSALLLRDGHLCSLAPDPGKTTSDWHPWIGSRREGDEGNPLLLHITLTPVQLQPGDRIILATAPAPNLAEITTFVPLVSTGSPEMAAESLSDVLQVQSGLEDAGVLVLDWGIEASSDSEGPSALFADLDDALVSGLEDLITDITDELDLLPATPPLAPVRDVTPEAYAEPVEPVEGPGETLIPDDVPEPAAGDEPGEPPLLTDEIGADDPLLPEPPPLPNDEEHLAAAPGGEATAEAPERDAGQPVLGAEPFPLDEHPSPPPDPAEDVRSTEPYSILGDEPPPEPAAVVEENAPDDGVETPGSSPPWAVLAGVVLLVAAIGLAFTLAL